MTKMFQYRTKNLVCFYIDNEYQIYEISNKELVAIYINQNNIKLNSKIPEDPTKYEYFEEMREIIKTIEDLA